MEIKSSTLQFHIVDITPQMAEEWLEKNTDNYRKLMPSRVKAYAADMRDGKWQLNGESICFYGDGTLANGQHRLKAITEAGVTVRMCVTTGVERNTYIYDTGGTRTSKDILKASGMDTGLANNLVIGAANLANRRANSLSRKITSEEAKRTIIKNQESLAKAFRFANTSSGKGKSPVGNSPSILAMACALNAGENEEIVKRFCEVTNTGFYTSKKEQAAIVFRNDMLNFGNKSGSDSQQKILCMAEKAINDFCRGYERRQSYRNTTGLSYAPLPLGDKS